MDHHLHGLVNNMMMILDKVEDEGDDVDAGAHRGDDDQGDEEEQVSEAKSSQQVVEHGSHRPEKKIVLAPKMPLYLYL